MRQAVKKTNTDMQVDILNVGDTNVLG